jgi:hypothetical protein
MKERTLDEIHFERLYLKKEIQAQKLVNKLQAIELEQARKEARKQARKARKKKKELREYSDSLAVSSIANKSLQAIATRQAKELKKRDLQEGEIKDRGSFSRSSELNSESLEALVFCLFPSIDNYPKVKEYFGNSEELRSSVRELFPEAFEEYEKNIEAPNLWGASSCLFTSSTGELVSAQHTLASILASLKQQEQEQASELVQESEAYNWEQVETSSEQQESSPPLPEKLEALVENSIPKAVRASGIFDTLLDLENEIEKLPITPSLELYKEESSSIGAFKFLPENEREEIQIKPLDKEELSSESTIDPREVW